MIFTDGVCDKVDDKDVAGFWALCYDPVSGLCEALGAYSPGGLVDRTTLDFLPSSTR